MKSRNLALSINKFIEGQYKIRVERGGYIILFQLFFYLVFTKTYRVMNKRPLFVVKLFTLSDEKAEWK